MHSSTSNTPWAAKMAMATLCVALGAGPAFAANEAELAQKSGCLACHRGAGELIGPPYKAVAEKYAGQKNAAPQIAEYIMKGTGPAGLGWMKAGKASLPAMPPNGNVSPQDAAKLAQWILNTTGEIAATSAFVTESVAISGQVAHPLQLTVAQLRRFPPQQVGEVSVMCQTGANRGTLENIKGVLLRDILEKAAIVSHSHNDVKKMAIIAIASDGYKVVFSWNEIFNSPIGEGVLVFFEKNGLPLGNDEGRIAMVSSRDTRTGPRHVKWLQAIEVRKVAE